jgi:sec-independent protein translocase protein TatA
MFGIGTTELMICMVICLILFGNRLPGVMKSLGQSAKSFRDGINETTDSHSPS